jgi:hypothetical protein
MKIIEKEFNVQTGVETINERNETAAETKARLDKIAEYAAFQAEAETKAAQKAAVLAKLGLTANEVAALLS